MRDVKGAEVVSLGRVRHLGILLEALDVGIPEDAVVYVENAGFAPDVRAALDALPQIPEDERRTDLQGTIWRAPTCFHIPARSGVLCVLRHLAETHADPEVCAHVAAYRGDEIIALAHDAGTACLLVAVTLPAANVARMRAVVARDIRRRRISPAVWLPWGMAFAATSAIVLRACVR